MKFWLSVGFMLSGFVASGSMAQSVMTDDLYGGVVTDGERNAHGIPVYIPLHGNQRSDGFFIEGLFHQQQIKSSDWVSGCTAKNNFFYRPATLRYVAKDVTVYLSVDEEFNCGINYEAIARFVEEKIEDGKNKAMEQARRDSEREEAIRASRASNKPLYAKHDASALAVRFCKLLTGLPITERAITDLRQRKHELVGTNTVNLAYAMGREYAAYGPAYCEEAGRQLQLKMHDSKWNAEN